MANSTDPFAQSVHGTDPQYLVEKITRLKVYNCDYWKSECFGLTSETIIDKAVALKYCGGTYGGNVKPTDFLALTLKMLQLQPEKDIVIAFIQNENFKYLRLLGALYMRLVGKPVDIYKYLEPLYNDYRKVAYRGSSGWSIKYIDQFIDSLLNDELVCDIALPHLPKRLKLEDLGILLPRKSALDIDINSYLLEIAASAVEMKEGKKDNVAITFDDDDESSVEGKETINEAAVQKDINMLAVNESNIEVLNQNDDKQIVQTQHKESENEKGRSSSRDRSNSHTRPTRDDSTSEGIDSHRSRAESNSQYRHSSHNREYSTIEDRNNRRDRYRSNSRNRDNRHASSSRDRNYHRSGEDRSSRDSKYSPTRDQSRSRNRDNHHSRVDRRSRERDNHRTNAHNASRHRDDHSSSPSHDRRSNQDREIRRDYDGRKTSTNDRRNSHKSENRSDESPKLLTVSSNEDDVINGLNVDSSNEINVKLVEERKLKLTDQKAIKRFDKTFKKSSSSSVVINKKDRDSHEKIEEFSVEYWNQRRESLGLKKLK